MLENLEGCKVKKIWHLDQYRRWTKKITEDEFVAIAAHINKYLDENASNSKPSAASILGQGLWPNPLLPIYYSCDKNEDRAGLCLGLIMQKVIMERGDKWTFCRTTDIKSIVYWRI